MPGGSISFAFRSRTSLDAMFSSVTVKLSGTSVLEGGNLVPSRHLLVDSTSVFDLSERPDASQFSFDVPIPENVACDCHRSKPTLPASTAVKLGGSDPKSPVSGSEIKIVYRAEIYVKRKKGWSKGTERVGSFVFPVGVVLPYGSPLPSLATRQDAFAVLERLPDSEWKSSDIVTVGSSIPPQSQNDSGISIRSVPLTGAPSAKSCDSLPSPPLATLAAGIGYWAAQLPHSILIGWKVTFRVSDRESGELLRILRADSLSLVLGRRLVRILADQQGGKAAGARLFEVNLPEGSSGTSGLTSTVDGSVALVTALGWFEVPLDLCSLPRSCNGEVRHFLVASLAVSPSSDPIKIGIELYRPQVKVVVSHPRVRPAKLSTLSTDSLPNPLAPLSKMSRKMSTGKESNHSPGEAHHPASVRRQQFGVRPHERSLLELEEELGR
ncbi:hypothetical protein RQP46_007075 [Phenoliferia psychrophenolica]